MKCPLNGTPNKNIVRYADDVVLTVHGDDTLQKFVKPAEKLNLGFTH